MPRVGDSFRRGDLRFEVVDLDRRRIDKVLIERQGGLVQATLCELTVARHGVILPGGSLETAAMSFVAPQRHQSLVIRRARIADAAPIAQVHVQSWRESYRGLVPDGYLDQLSVAGHERQWRRSFRRRRTWAFVAEWEQRIVGFASGGLSRARRDISGELYLLYVLRASHGRGDRPRAVRRLPLRTRPLRPSRAAGLGSGRELRRAASMSGWVASLSGESSVTIAGAQAARGRLRLARLSAPAQFT